LKLTKTRVESNTLNTKDKRTGIFLILGLQPTVIESQVILTCRALIDQCINIEIWSLCSSRKSYNDAQIHLSKWDGYGIRFTLFRGVRSGIPFSELMNAVIFGYKLFIHKKKPSFIHCRTEYPTVVALLLKPILGTKVIWDSRGDSKSEFILYIKELPKIKRLLSPVALLQIRIRLLLSKKFADWCIFVSESLRNIYFTDHKNNYTVIPCVADKKYFFFNQELRELTRNKLSLQPSDVVLIYSGSMALWQCIDETINLIEDHLRANENHKAIILTPDSNKFLTRFPSGIRHRLICCSVGLQEVNQYLNAADFAIFLRRKNIINQVASPVKFAEYSLAGLPIIMTDAVDQAYNYSVNIGNLVNFDFEEGLNLVEKNTDSQRLVISMKSEELLSRDNLINSLSEIYKLLI
jgi:hypothetical protein